MLPRRHFWFACNGRLADTGAQREHLLQFRQRRQEDHRQHGTEKPSRSKIVQSKIRMSRLARRFHMIGDAADKFDDLTRSFVHLSNLPTYPPRSAEPPRGHRRQARQILFALQYLDRRKPWDIMQIRAPMRPLPTTAMVAGAHVAAWFESEMMAVEVLDPSSRTQCSTGCRPSSTIGGRRPRENGGRRTVFRRRACRIVFSICGRNVANPCA